MLRNTEIVMKGKSFEGSVAKSSVTVGKNETEITPMFSVLHQPGFLWLLVMWKGGCSVTSFHMLWSVQTYSATRISALTSTRLLQRNLIKWRVFSHCHQLSWGSFKFSQVSPPSIQAYVSNQLLNPSWIFDLVAAWPFLGLWYKMNK